MNGRSCQIEEVQGTCVEVIFDSIIMNGRPCQGEEVHGSCVLVL